MDKLDLDLRWVHYLKPRGGFALKEDLRTGYSPEGKFDAPDGTQFSLGRVTYTLNYNRRTKADGADPQLPRATRELLRKPDLSNRQNPKILFVTPQPGADAQLAEQAAQADDWIRQHAPLSWIRQLNDGEHYAIGGLTGLLQAMRDSPDDCPALLQSLAQAKEPTPRGDVSLTEFIASITAHHVKIAQRNAFVSGR